MISLYNKKQQKVGELIDNVYYSNRRPEHFMIMHKGFGISLSILERLKGLGCLHICLIYENKKGEIIKYKCPFMDYINSDLTYIDVEEDLQKFVPVSRMNKVNEEKKDETL